LEAIRGESRQSVKYHIYLKTVKPYFRRSSDKSETSHGLTDRPGRATLEPMPNRDYPMTQAVRALKDQGADFTIHEYAYEEHGGTTVAARELGADEHAVIKTLVFETETRVPFLVLMHGDRDVSAKNLARALGVKTVTPCSPDTAQRHTGYQVGGISPFGTRKRLPVQMERTLIDCPKVFINAGKRGMLAELAPAEIVRLLNPGLVDVAI
jgi:Cys-tRNA(Pro) deacylase